MVEKLDTKEVTGETSDADFVMAMKNLAATALTGRDPLTRKHAIYLIGSSQNPDCIPILIQALKDPEKAVRGQATQALALVGEPASNSLIDLLYDQDWKVRYRAAEALGMIGSKDAASPLIRMLSDKKDHVRYMAAKSLGMLHVPPARESLQKLLTDENAYVRKMASSALLKIGN
jgi:HEAT repeat protein